MGLFSNNKEKLKTALVVIESDRRSKTQYDLREENRSNKAVIATLIAVLVVGAILLMLPKPKSDGLDRRNQGVTKTK